MEVIYKPKKNKIKHLFFDYLSKGIFSLVLYIEKTVNSKYSSVLKLNICRLIMGQHEQFFRSFPILDESEEAKKLILATVPLSDHVNTNHTYF
jgi:hypothetical protein